MTPDVVTLAKALGGGLPIGACVAREEVAEAFRPGDHATTFGGGPVPCAAALAVLEVISTDGLVENSARMGELLVAKLREALDATPAVKDVRGVGLLVGVELAGEYSRDVVDACRERGLLVNNVRPDMIRLSPPLIVTADEVERAVAILAGVLKERRVSVAEAGAAKAWILAFILMAGLGIGGLIGVGCLVGANTCPGSSPPKQTSTDGKTLYLANCAACHGIDASGSRGPSLIAGPLGKLSEDELVKKIGKGKPLAGMPRFRKALTQEQIRAIADYAVSLRGGS